MSRQRVGLVKKAILLPQTERAVKISLRGADHRHKWGAFGVCVRCGCGHDGRNPFEIADDNKKAREAR